jgi:hypothetical protein
MTILTLWANLKAMLDIIIWLIGPNLGRTRQSDPSSCTAQAQRNRPRDPGKACNVDLGSAVGATEEEKAKRRSRSRR